MGTADQGPPYTADGESRARSIDEIDLHDFSYESWPVVKFVLAFAVGAFFFLVPVPWQGQLTVPMDIVVSTVLERFPDAVGLLAMSIIVAGGLLTTIALLEDRDVVSTGYDVSYFDTSTAFWFLRAAGAVLAPVMFFKLGPELLHAQATGHFMWHTLVYSVAVIIPLGATFVTIFVEVGGLEFVGTLARPLMRPLFKLPGRSALDCTASWIASFTIGMYVTRNVFERGAYSKRDVFTIVTCFSTVSIGFVGVVLATLGMLSLFPVVMICYFVAIGICGFILVRIPPLSTTPDEYIATPDPEAVVKGSPSEYFRLAVSEAVKEAEDSEGFVGIARRGFLDGLKITATILGTILAVGLAAMLVEVHTPIFHILGGPLVPVFEALGLPNAETLAPATLLGITEMYVPVLLVTEAEPMAKFFVALMSISQLIFFSSQAPMAMDMFREVPIRFRDLIALFVMRTVILIPVVAAMTHIVAALGLI